MMETPTRAGTYTRENATKNWGSVRHVRAASQSRGAGLAAVHLKLAAVTNHDGHGALSGLGALAFHGLDNVEAVNHTAEHNVLAVEPVANCTWSLDANKTYHTCLSNADSAAYDFIMSNRETPKRDAVLTSRS